MTQQVFITSAASGFPVGSTQALSEQQALAVIGANQGRPANSVVPRSVSPLDTNPAAQAVAGVGMIPNISDVYTAVANAMALAAAVAVGGCSLPPGKFYVATNVVFAKSPGVMRGAGANNGAYFFSTTQAGSLAEQNAGTTLATTSRTGWLLGIDVSGFTVRDIHFQNESAVNGTGIATAGGGIRIGSQLAATGLPSSQANATTIEDCSFYGFWNDIDHYSADSYKLCNNNILNFVNAGISINNLYNPGTGNPSDYGDPIISGNQITSGLFSAGATGILWQSGGGVKIIGNKINGNGLGSATYGLKYGINATAAAATTTSVIVINANSVEGITGATGAGVNIGVVSGGNLSLVNITSNEFHTFGTGSGINVAGISTSFIGGVVIQGNQFNNCCGNNGINVSYAQNVSIARDNNFIGVTNGQTMVSIGANVVQSDFDTVNADPTSLSSGQSITLLNCSSATSLTAQGFRKNSWPRRVWTDINFPTKQASAANFIVLFPGNSVAFTGCRVRVTLEGNMAGVGGIFYTGERALCVDGGGVVRMAPVQNFAAAAAPNADQVVVAGTAVTSIVGTGATANQSIVTIASGAENSTSGINIEWNNFAGGQVYLRAYHTSGSAAGSTNAFSGTMTVELQGSMARIDKYVF